MDWKTKEVLALRRRGKKKEEAEVWLWSVSEEFIVKVSESWIYD